MIRTDGIRSTNKIWFAKKLLRQLDGDGSTRKQIDGYGVKVWRYDDYEGADITAPPGFAVVADTATGMDIYLAEPMGAPAIAHSITIYPRRNIISEQRIHPYISVVPRGNDFIDVGFERVLFGEDWGASYTRKECITGGVVAYLSGGGVVTTSVTDANHACLVAGTSLTVHALATWESVMINALVGNTNTRVDIDVSVLAPFVPDLSSVAFAMSTRIDDDDVRVFLYAQRDAGIHPSESAGMIELAVLLTDGFIGVYFLGASFSVAAQAMYVASRPFRYIYSEDANTTFQDASGRMCNLQYGGDFVRSVSATSYVQSTLVGLPGSLNPSALQSFDTSLANGGLYIHQHWEKVAGVGSLSGLYWGSPFTGAWTSIPLPTGAVRTVRPLYCDANRRAMLAVSVMTGDAPGTYIHVLDTEKSPDWSSFALTVDSLDDCGISPYGSHEYSPMMLTYPSTQWICETVT